MSLADLFNSKEELISIDIGESSIKILELDMGGGRPKLLNIGVTPLSQDVFVNNIIKAPETVSEQIHTWIEANRIGDKRIVTAMPSSNVFTKRITMQKMGINELSNNIQFEAGNFIPHNIDDVKLDYHIIGESSANDYDVLVAAVKNEIIDSYLEALTLAGLEVAVVDVDYFALQNAFELSYPEHFSNTVALINIGARYSSINICRSGDSLFTGNIAVGGKLFTEAIREETGLSFKESEALKKNLDTSHEYYALAQDVIERNLDFASSEINRQLSFFWNASGADGRIDQIVLTGGCSQLPGMREELQEKTGVDTSFLDPFKGLEIGTDFEAAYLEELKPYMAICVGMGLRQPGDKLIPD